MPKHDLIIIGAGPGGYVAAIRAAQLGLDVACIEKEAQLGGTCLRVGCIPSKALLESSERFAEAKSALKQHGVLVGDVKLDLKAMLKRKTQSVTMLTKGIEGLLKKNKIKHYQGHATILSAGKVEVKGKKKETLEAEHIIIATGSQPTTIPGVEFDGDRIGSSTEALSYPEVPKKLIVIGAGVIGLELGSVWNRLGSEVTVLEYFDRILPGMDNDLAKEAQKLFTKQGIKFHLSKRVTAAEVKGKSCSVTCEGDEPLDADRVLVCVGRKPNTEGLGLDEAGIKIDQRGRVDVDEHFKTNIDGIYAIGDVIRGPMLAHKAEEEGIACVEQIVNGYGHVNYDAIPSVVYTHPEIASVGKTEEELKEAEIPYKKGNFPYRANGRARSVGETDGFAKILAHAETDRILGAHIIGANAGELIAETVAAIEFAATSEDLARTSHAHPTLAEVLKEASLAVDGRAIHM